MRMTVSGWMRVCVGGLVYEYGCGWVWVGVGWWVDEGGFVDEGWWVYEKGCQCMDGRGLLYE